MNITNALTPAAWVLCASMSATVTAGEFNSRNLLIGDRAIGLGGAYVALADDPSGLYYNPAGIAYAKRDGSMSLNALSQSSTEYEDVLPGGGALARESTVIIPGFFGVMADTALGHLGFYLATTDHAAERKSNRFSLDDMPGLSGGNGTFSNDVDTSAYQVGLAWGQVLDARWSLGTSLNLLVRDNREIRRLDATAVGNSGARLATLTSIRTSDISYAVQPLIGLQYRRPESLSVGLTLSRPFVIRREYEYDYRHISSTHDAAGAVLASTDEQVSVESGHSQAWPWHLALGTAVFVGKDLLLTFSIDHHGKVAETPLVLDPAAPPVTRAYQAATNVSAGVEWIANEAFTLRSAVFTDRSNTRLSGAQAFERREQINLLGLSLSGSARFGERVFEAGIYGTTGKGHAALGDLSELDFTPSGTVKASKTQFVLFFGIEL